MKVKHELTKNYGLISLMENFGWTKSLRNILGGLKPNVGIFKGTIYLFNLILNKIFSIFKLLNLSLSLYAIGQNKILG